MSQAPESARSPRFPFANPIGVLFVVLCALAAIDVAHDLRDGTHASLEAIELTVMAAVLGIAMYYRSRLRRALGHASKLVTRLHRANADAERWRREAANVLPALGAAIRRQLDRWGLTEDERRVALLLLSGLSLQDIALRLGMGIQPVRQLALSLYEKAGVTGRVELSAFFLQDVFYLVGVPTDREQRLIAQA